VYCRAAWNKNDLYFRGKTPLKRFTCSFRANFSDDGGREVARSQIVHFIYSLEVLADFTASFGQIDENGKPGIITPGDGTKYCCLVGAFPTVNSTVHTSLCDAVIGG
jgi:hypothetical protein